MALSLSRMPKQHFGSENNITFKCENTNGDFDCKSMEEIKYLRKVFF